MNKDWKTTGRTQIVNQLTFDKTVTPHQKLVYNIIRSHMNSKTRKCFPSVETIMREGKLSKKFVKKARKVLAEKGYITWKTEWMKDEKGWDKLRCYYDFPLENTLNKSEKGGSQAPFNNKKGTRRKEQVCSN